MEENRNMTPRKILIVVVIIAALLAILIAVSGPYGDAELESSVPTVHSSDIMEGNREPADHTGGVVYIDQEEESEAITEENFMVRDNLFRAEVEGTSVRISYSEPITNEYVSGFFSKEDSKYGLASAGIKYSFPEEGLMVVEFPEIATPRRIARWMGMWFEDLQSYMGR